MGEAVKFYAIDNAGFVRARECIVNAGCNCTIAIF
jgi:hypothetical protein